MEESIKTSTQNNVNEGQFINLYENHSFVNSLVDFEEEVDEWDNRETLPAIMKRNCYIPIPPDNSSANGIK